MKYVLFINGWPTMTSANYVMLLNLRHRQLVKDSLKCVQIVHINLAQYM